MTKDYYKILGVSNNSTLSEIKRKYRQLMHEIHPDKGGDFDTEKLSQIQEAYKVLSDGTKRMEYDRNKKMALTDKPLETAIKIWNEIIT